MDLWWVRGPINFWSDGGRVVEVRCEPGVGGRIVEVLDDPALGEVFERARLTQWEPGVRLAWESDLDDVQTEVRFAPIDGGTRVTVEHSIPADGEDRGGTAWSRVVPGWFGAWCAMRDRVPHQQIDIAAPCAGVSYARPAAACVLARAGSPTCSDSALRAIFRREPTHCPKATTATRGSSSGSATRAS